jgi:hypothetical protein
VVALVATLGEARADAPMFDLGAWLVERRGLIEGSEAAWLDVLAEFDAHEGWAADGQLSGADWLMWRTKMARSTAFEKLRIAHQLRRRPRVAAAFAAGEISYSAVRAITRLEGTSPEVDEALVTVARDSSVVDLEQAIRHYRLNDDQDRDLSPWHRRHDRRGVRLDRGFSGMGSAEIRLSSVELEELHVTLEAFLDRGGPVDESPHADCEGGPTSWAERRADAFMELVRTGLANAQNGGAVGADRYMVHEVIDLSAPASTSAPGPTRNGRLIDGTPLGEELERILCDCSVVAHVTVGGEPLELGRKTKVWNTAQRRAITVRDGARCRFPGCRRTIVDIHHLRWWSRGGATDVSNGCLCCTRHHTLLHKGFYAEGDANHELTFYRPDDTVIDVSPPAGRTARN